MNSSKRNLLKDYVYTITHYLPQKQKDDVARDIEATLYELLLEQFGEKDYTDQEIEIVIRAFGQPRMVAERYLNQKPSLIAPELLETYWFVVKIALIGSNIGVLIARILAQGLDFISILGGMINLSLSVFGMVTLIFILINQKMDVYEKNNDQTWSLSELKTWTNDKHRVNHFEIAVESIFLVFMAQALIINKPLSVVLENHVQFLLGMYVGLCLVLNIYLLIKAYWTPRLRIISISLNLIFAYVLAQFLIVLPVLFKPIMHINGVSLSIRITSVIIFGAIAYDVFDHLKHLIKNDH
ncbi:MAG TPA: hypothetical protein DIC19_00975 [Erysipelotrichaceae bacterium]|nr:hypothetical protein [Erysipelotrichaceae bacterium]